MSHVPGRFDTVHTCGYKPTRSERAGTIVLTTLAALIAAISLIVAVSQTYCVWLCN